MDQASGDCRFLETMLAGTGFQTWRDSPVARFGAEDRSETGSGTIAAIGRNHRGHRLVTALWTAVAGAPCVAEDGRAGSGSKCDDDGENREPRHGDRLLVVEQERGQTTVCSQAGDLASSPNQSGISRCSGENSPLTKPARAGITIRRPMPGRYRPLRAVVP